MFGGSDAVKRAESLGGRSFSILPHRLGVTSKLHGRRPVGTANSTLLSYTQSLAIFYSLPSSFLFTLYSSLPEPPPPFCQNSHLNLSWGEQTSKCSVRLSVAFHSAIFLHTILKVILPLAPSHPRLVTLPLNSLRCTLHSLASIFRKTFPQFH